VLLPPRARAIFLTFVWGDGRQFWTRNFKPRRITLDVLSKMECARSMLLRQSYSLELCPDWPEKRPSKSIYKTNEILTFWLQRPSDVRIRASRCCLFFLSKKCKSTFENQKLEGEAHFWKCYNAFGATLTDVWWILHMFFFVGISVELMKSQGDFPHKWILGNRHVSCLSWVCFRRRQNGVHQTPLIISSNEFKLLTYLQSWQNVTWYDCQK